MRSKNLVDGEGAPMDYCGLIYRASYTYMMAGQMGSFGGKQEAVNYIEILLCPYYDKEYHEDADYVEKSVKWYHKGEGASQDMIHARQLKNREILLTGKYMALMKLAHRCGFLPPVKMQSNKQTEIML